MKADFLLDMAGCVPFLVAGTSQALPLQSRVAKSSNKTKVQVPFLPQRPTKYRDYSSTSMDKACEAVKTGKMSLRRAAIDFGVPRSTLYDKVSVKATLKGVGKKRYSRMKKKITL